MSKSSMGLINFCIFQENESAEILVFAVLVFVLLTTIYLDSGKGRWWHHKLLATEPIPPKLEHGKTVHRKSIDSLPGPKPFPIITLIGNLFQLPGTNELIPKCFEWCANYGPCFRLSLFNEQFVVISSAPLAQSILQSKELGHLTKTDVYHFLQGIDGLAFASGTWWSSMRKITANVFRYQRIDNQMQHYNNHGDQLVQILGLPEDQRQISAEEAIINCTVQIIIDAFITQPGITTYAESLNYLRSWKRFTEITTYRIMHPWLGLKFLWNLHPQSKTLNEEIGKVEKYAETLINRQKDNIIKNSEQISGTPAKTLISELIRLNYTDKQIRSEVVAMLFAHETNSLGLYYLLYMLAAHPDHQDICRKEVDLLFNNNQEPNDQYISNDQLSCLKYLEKCLMETMRLLPPVFIFGRKLETELSLCNGVHLPTGTNTLILPLVIHQMEEYYTNPNVFDPDRFSPEESRKRHAYAYLPFSAGPRICLGMKSSLANVKIITAKIIRKFVISSPCKFEDLRFKGNLTMSTEQDLDLQFLPREQLRLR